MQLRKPAFTNTLRMVFAGSFVSQIVQVGVFPILIAQLLKNGGMASYEIGFFAAISWITILVSSSTVPRLIARSGYAVTNLAASLLTLISLILLMVSTAPLSVAAASILMGFGLIVRWITCDTAIVDICEPDRRGKIVGWHEALMGMGIAVGPLMFSLFSIEQVAPLAILMVVLSQLAFWAAGLGKGTEDVQSEPSSNDFSHAILIVALAAALIAGFIESSSVVFLPIHFEFFGYSLQSSAILVSSFGLGGTVLQPLLGWTADRLSYAAAQMICLLTIAASCIVIALLPSSWPILLVATFFLGGAGGGLNTLAVIEAGKTIHMEQMAKAMTAIAVAYTLGSIAGPMLAGAAINLINHQGLIVLYMAISLLLGFFILLRKKPKP